MLTLQGENLLLRTRLQQIEGQPCGHPGCLHHLTHPCERCGRIGGGVGGNMRPEEATQTVDGTKIKILGKRAGKFFGYWVDGLGNAHPAKWSNSGKLLQSSPADALPYHYLNLDLTDWRDEIPWNVLADWVQVVVREPNGRWLACEYEPLSKNIHGWVGGGYVLFINAIKMPEGPADWREAIAERPKDE